MTQDKGLNSAGLERYDPETKKAMMDEWMHCVRTGELWEYEHRILGPDKRYRTVLSRGRPVRDDKGEYIHRRGSGVNLDITDRKRAENEVLRKNEELQRLLARIRELDEAKSTFFANVSHELRTPLALILGPVDKLLGHELMPDQREELLVVRRNAATLLKQVNALLDLSKIDAGKMALHYARIDLAGLVRLVAGHFDGLARQRASTTGSTYPIVCSRKSTSKRSNGFCSTSCPMPSSSCPMVAGSSAPCGSGPAMREWWCATMVRAFPPRTVSASSSASARGMRPDTGHSAAPAWGCPSSMISSICTVGASRSGKPRTVAPSSRSPFPCTPLRTPLSLMPVKPPRPKGGSWKGWAMGTMPAES